jgi:hypothetical protein
LRLAAVGCGLAATPSRQPETMILAIDKKEPEGEIAGIVLVRQQLKIIVATIREITHYVFLDADGTGRGRTFGIVRPFSRIGVFVTSLVGGKAHRVLPRR